jgi:5-methylcytosine-specific restriction endonuclease McrA
MTNAEYQRKWYKKNYKKQIEKVRLNRIRLREYIQSVKMKSKCLSCGFSNPIALQFHHINPSTKEFDLSHAHLTGRSIKNIQKEIDKCIVLCANCHFILHKL